MIGIYDYTVVLTYLSLLSAGSGIVISLSGKGHPFMGMFCLLFCGLCDAFDGMVARTKKNRTQMEKNYGIQIDSLSDIVAFGVLPACIGSAVIRRSEMLQGPCTTESGNLSIIYFLLHAILVLYILAALIRLAYFNVTEEERQQVEGEKCRKEYTGLPVTSAALIFPIVLLIDFMFKSVDLGLLYFVVTILMSFAFLLKFKIKKPGLRGILIMIGIGVIEGLLLLLVVLSSKGVI